jgi:hypothetical protein
MKTYAVKKLAIALVAMFLAVTGVGPVMAQKASDKPVVKLDPGFDALVSPDAKLELVRAASDLPKEPSGSRMAKADICCSAISPPM